MTKRLGSGHSPSKEQQYKMHGDRLESKKRKKAAELIQRKKDWDNDVEWQEKKKAMKLAKIERKRKEKGLM